MPDLLPPNATPAERALSEATARLGAVPVEIRDVWSPDRCPEALLPWLADAFSVDQWDQNWTEAQKRAFIKASVSVHRRKGTISAIAEALAALSYSARIQEWFAQEIPGDPFTFRVLIELEQEGISLSSFAALFELIERTKNVRSHISSIELSIRSRAPLYAAGFAAIGSEITLSNYVQPGTVVLNETALIF